jgi:hypothetical protein
MFEISIVGVIVLALAYCTTLWVMGRREDVLHGQFVNKVDFPADEPARTVIPEPTAFRPERLQSLLASIKQDLDRLAPK